MFKDKESPFNVCPYRFNQCTNPDYDHCKIRVEARRCTSTTNYVKVTNKALRCEFLGLKLSQEQFEHRRIGVLT